MNKFDVISAFINGKEKRYPPSRQVTKQGRGYVTSEFDDDGNLLFYSFDMVIAKMINKVVHILAVTGDYSFSPTTSRHVIDLSSYIHRMNREILEGKNNVNEHRDIVWVTPRPSYDFPEVMIGLGKKIMAYEWFVFPEKYETWSVYYGRGGKRISAYDVGEQAKGGWVLKAWAVKELKKIPNTYRSVKVRNKSVIQRGERYFIRLDLGV